MELETMMMSRTQPTLRFPCSDSFPGAFGSILGSHSSSGPPGSCSPLIRCHGSGCLLPTFAALLPEELDNVGWQLLSRHDHQLSPFEADMQEFVDLLRGLVDNRHMERSRVRQGGDGRVGRFQKPRNRFRKMSGSTAHGGD